MEQPIIKTMERDPPETIPNPSCHHTVKTFANQIINALAFSLIKIIVNMLMASICIYIEKCERTFRSALFVTEYLIIMSVKPFSCYSK